jgi:hypothetical protein
MSSGEEAFIGIVTRSSLVESRGITSVDVMDGEKTILVGMG